MMECFLNPLELSPCGKKPIESVLESRGRPWKLIGQPVDQSDTDSLACSRLPVGARSVIRSRWNPLGSSENLSSTEEILQCRIFSEKCRYVSAISLFSSSQLFIASSCSSSMVSQSNVKHFLILYVLPLHTWRKLIGYLGKSETDCHLLEVSEMD